MAERERKKTSFSENWMGTFLKIGKENRKKDQNIPGYMRIIRKLETIPLTTESIILCSQFLTKFYGRLPTDSQ